MKETDQDFLKQKFGSTGHLFSYITQTYGRSPSGPVHLFIVLPREDVTVEKIQDAAGKRGITFNAKLLCNNLYRVKLGVKVRRVEGFLLVEKDWWLLITRGKGSDSFDVFVKSFVKNHFFPLIQPAYIDSQEMVELITNLSPTFGNLILEEFSMASERGTLREWLVSGANFSSDVARSLQKKYDSSFTGARIMGVADGSASIRMRVYTESRLCFLSGSFGDFYEFVVMPFVHSALHMNKRYKNRERKVTDGRVKLFGIRIEAEEEFSGDDLLSVRSFIQKRYSVILNYENPIVALQATDLRDGSSFDLYLTELGIEVVPLLKASSGSLLELCTSIVRRLPPFASFKPIPPVETLYQ